MNVNWTRRALALMGVAGLVSGLSALTSVAANAEDIGACATPWTATTAYTAGDTVSEGGMNYTANWWTQGDDPATKSGTTGSGQPWTSAGSCSASESGNGSGSSSGDGGGNDAGSSDSGGTTGTGSADGLVFSPYKDITVNLDWNTNSMRTAVTGSAMALVGSSSSFLSSAEPNVNAVSLAFATGTCGSENWGGVSGEDFAAANISDLDKAGVDYVISTGGAAGSFRCDSVSGLNSFIARYSSDHLIGIDFDIEGGQSQADIENLVKAAAGAQTTYPNLRFSFTLATLAASDGSYGGLNSLGNEVVNAVQASELTNYTINLMTMDFGAATSSNCVVADGVCDMGASTIQAAKNLEHTYGVPASKIELTPMIGVNDVSSETFTLDDAATVSAWAKANGIAGVHEWSLDRDTPCSQTTASPTCSSTSTSALAYTNAFLSALS